MIPRIALLAPALLLLSACDGDQDDDLVLSEEDISVTLTGAELPTSWALVTTFALLGDETSCPSVTEVSQTEWTLEGGCTGEDDAEWLGSATVTEAADGSGTLSYDGFGSSSTEMSVTLDGEQAIGADDVLTSELTARWDPGTGQEIVLDYTGYRLETFQSYVDGAFGNDASASLSGTMDIDTLTTFEVTGSWTQDGTCTEEWPQGTLTLVGAPEGDVVFTWGDCNGCIQWAHAGRTGERCD